MALSYKEVAEILKMVDASDCQEVVLEVEGTKLVVRRGAAGAAAVTTAPAPAPAAPPASAPVPPAAEAAAPAPTAPAPTTAAPQQPAAAEGQTIVRAPMVGTFYRRPAPEEPPFVEPGSRVKKGDALCLIEVMKLYTTIEAPCDGVIESVVAEDGVLAEFDQALFVIAAG